MRQGRIPPRKHPDPTSTSTPMARLALASCPQERQIQAIKTIRVAVQEDGGYIGLKDAKDLVQAASLNHARQLPYDFSEEAKTKLAAALEQFGCVISVHSSERIALALDALATLANAMRDHPHLFEHLEDDYRAAVIAESDTMLEEEGIVRRWSR